GLIGWLGPVPLGWPRSGGAARLVRAGPARAGPTRAAPLGWLRLAAVMGGTLVTHGGDIATACHQRPAHPVVRGRGGARAVRDASAPRIGPESAPRRAEAPRARSASDGPFLHRPSSSTETAVPWNRRHQAGTLRGIGTVPTPGPPGLQEGHRH